MIVRKRYRLGALAAFMVFAACTESTTAPEGPAPSLSTSSSALFTSGAHVDTWNAIVPVQNSNWVSQVCVPQPAVALNDPRWVNPHKAFVANGAAFRSWTGKFIADWVNAWPGYEWYGLTSAYGGPPGSLQQSWTRYSTPVSGNGTFTLWLAADNCSWVYITNLDGSNPQLVGVQLGAPWVVNIEYPVTLNGNHLLQFLVFDGGGQSGGMFKLETTSVVYVDTDGDGLADVSETNIHLTDPNDPDTDNDGVNDGDEVAAGTNPRVAEVIDTDGDGIKDDIDNCPAVANADQANFDGDGQGDACDADDDNDGTPDTSDAFPKNPAETTDTDGDGIGNNADTDDDGDGYSDADENANGTNPLSAASTPPDFDNDKVSDLNDPDDDNDGVPDASDAFPKNAAESVDTDGDGIGNNADTDDDNDGYKDADEIANGTNPLNAGSTPPDNDGDKVSDLNDPDDDNDGVPDTSDAFDFSNKAPTVVIGTCNSGVANKHLGNGSWFNDLIGAARAAAANHGKFVSAVSDLADGWKKAGLISGAEQGAIVSCAARSK